MATTANAQLAAATLAELCAASTALLKARERGRFNRRDTDTARRRYVGIARRGVHRAETGADLAQQLLAQVISKTGKERKNDNDTKRSLGKVEARAASGYPTADIYLCFGLRLSPAQSPLWTPISQLFG